MSVTMRNDLWKLKKATDDIAKDIPRMVYEAMDDALKVIAESASGMYIIQTGASRGSKLDKTSRAVDATRLTSRTGELIRSLIRGDHPYHIRDIVASNMQVKGSVGSALRYARIHELGGQTSPHVILPRYKSVLSFFVGDKRIFTRRVNHPGSIIHPRPFLRPAIENTEVQNTVKQFLGNNFLAEVKQRMQMALAK